MFRASRPLLRPGPGSRAVASISPLLARPRLSRRPVALPTARVASSSSSSSNPPPPKPPIDREHEKKAAQKIIEPRPSEVSATSSVRPLLESSPSSAAKDEPDLGRELRHDVNIVRDTFRLSQVPRESHILGLAGTIPYLATSLSTVFLAWDLNKELPTGNALYDAVFVNHDTAQHLLDVIEPLQLGYGAVIISFLGAIHWGLEYAEKTPLLQRTRFRYGIGVAASVVAWPTLFMPLEYALTTQFMAFVALYFVDSRAASRGWAPRWYGTYRFLLTAMVGLAILVSLAGRAKISQHGRLSSQGLSSSMSDPGIADMTTDWAKLEAEEKARIKKEKEEAANKAEKRSDKKRDAKDSESDKTKDRKDESSNGKKASEKQDDAKEGGEQGQGDFKKKSSS